MSFFKNLFGKRPSRQNAGLSYPDLPLFCYRLAYQVLPEFLTADLPRTVGYFTNPDLPAGQCLYALGCSVLERAPRFEEGEAFQVHNGDLIEGKIYHVLQYPTPPPIEMDETDILKNMNVVLAPFFSAIITDRETAEYSYYILGQRPFGGTTLRRIFSGANANLGEGPSPQRDAFLDALRDKMAASDTNEES